MLVDQVRSGIGRVTVPHVGDELYLGMPFLDGLVEERPAFVVGGTAVLIADLHVLQVERRGMAVSGAGGAPEAIGRAIGIFDCVQGVLHPRPHAVERDVLVM